MKNTRTGRLSGKKPKKDLAKRGEFQVTNKQKKSLDHFFTSEKKENTSSLVRINKQIKDLGLASRRDADKLIEQKRVLVNGAIAKLGDKVSISDRIEISGTTKTALGASYKYLLFYKPRDVVSHSPQYGENEVKDFFPTWDKDGLTIVGRLDKHSEGLMFVTNDKRLVERILNPRFSHERTYEVSVQEKLSKNIINLFSKGFTVKNRFTAKPAKVELVDNFKMLITLTEGKKHQIRLMLNELHYTVSKLKRIKILNLTIKGLEPGKFKEVQKEEVQKLLKSVGLTNN
jgi:23S rRNA pseudouridine2604 synthase